MDSANPNYLVFTCVADCDDYNHSQILDNIFRIQMQLLFSINCYEFPGTNELCELTIIWINIIIFSCRWRGCLSLMGFVMHTLKANKEIKNQQLLIPKRKDMKSQFQIKWILLWPSSYTFLRNSMNSCVTASLSEVLFKASALNSNGWARMVRTAYVRNSIYAANETFMVWYWTSFRMESYYRIHKRWYSFRFKK